MSRQSVNTWAQPSCTNAFKDAKRRIVGTNRRAIITVDQDAPRPRQRFSVGHELGHWMHDRGTAAFACDAETVSGPWDELLNLEARANRYAANLLLPTKMFKPRAARRPMLFETFALLRRHLKPVSLPRLYALLNTALSRRCCLQ